MDLPGLLKVKARLMNEFLLNIWIKLNEKLFKLLRVKFWGLFDLNSVRLCLWIWALAVLKKSVLLSNLYFCFILFILSYFLYIIMHSEFGVWGRQKGVLSMCLRWRDWILWWGLQHGIGLDIKRSGGGQDRENSDRKFG